VVLVVHAEFVDRIFLLSSWSPCLPSLRISRREMTWSKGIGVKERLWKSWFRLEAPTKKLQDLIRSNPTIPLLLRQMASFITNQIYIVTLLELVYLVIFHCFQPSDGTSGTSVHLENATRISKL
jgi:hypothetical protein